MHRRVAVGVGWSAFLLVAAVSCGGSGDVVINPSDGGATSDGESIAPADATADGPGGSDAGTSGADGGADGAAPADGGGDGGAGDGGGDGGVGDGGGDGGDGGDGGGPVVTTTYASSLAAGRDIACVIATGGALKCWGAMTPPAAVAPGNTWKQVAVGGLRTDATACAIRSDDTLWCWSGVSGTPSQPDTAAFKYVGVALSNRCAVAATGALYCWGNNNVFGPLGTGDTISHPSPTQVGADVDWKVVAPGNNHTCGLKTGGGLYCWGWNAFGQIGDGTVVQRNVPVAVDALSTYVDVDTKGVASCGVRSDGALLCWGSGLLPGVTITPTTVDSAKDWAKVRLATSHTCALKTNGSLYCWGSNDRGQLALPVAAASISRTSPSRIGTDLDWADVAVGDGFTCATKKDTTVRCWGTNGSGQLAQSPPGHPTPTRIGAASEFSSATAGPNNVCAVRKNGSLACWGIGGGMPTAGVLSQTPVTIGSANDWKTAKPGYAGACATKTNDLLHCWATGSSPATTNLTVSAYDVGQTHQCAIASGSLYCWGEGIFGKLGNGSNTNLAVPTKVGADTWKAIATGVDSTCAIKTDGTLSCFGFGFTSIEKQGVATTWSALDQTPGGQPYFGLQGSVLYAWDWITAVTSSGSENDWTSIAVGASHVCGIRAGGTLWCKGDNAYGQLGDGTLVPRVATAAQVGVGTDWVSVTAGTFFTCGVRGAGDLYCWGSNDYGEMGDGTSVKSDPVVVP